jgi:hypothetical protein
MISQSELIDIVATEGVEGISRDLLIRRYRVHGFCLVPTECTMMVDAPSPEEAVRIAIASRWQDHIDQNGGDDRSAFDWRPNAEAIESPTAPASATEAGQ